MKKTTAVVSMPGQGSVISALGSRLTIRVRAEQTDGRLSIIDFEAPPGFSGPPMPQRHRDMDWSAYMLEGALWIELDGESFEVPSGGMVHVPRGAAFRFRNASNERPMRWLLTYTPGGFERYFEDLAAALSALGRAPAVEDLAAVMPPLWPKYGVEVVTA